MNFEYGLFNSAFKHYKYKRASLEDLKEKTLNMKVCKNEKFAFQVMIKGDESFYTVLNKNVAMTYRGLINRLRLEIIGDLKDFFNIYIEGYVKDETGALVADPILKDSKVFIEKDMSQMFWIEGKIPKHIKSSKYNLKIRMYYQTGYEDEEKLEDIEVSIDVASIELKNLKDSEYFLDLWQHPSNWARMYNVELWSEEHFNIIDNYLKDLGDAGEKVATVIASDFPWAGQSCYEIQTNASNLYEYNMVKIQKNKINFEFDFSVLDKYLEICFKHGINKEIDIFGIMCNWSSKDFGNPLKDHDDPIRINYYDKNSNTFKFMNTKKDVKIYIKALFEYFKNKNIWEKVRIISDEPNDLERFEIYKDFLSTCLEDGELNLKCAIHDLDFLINKGEEIKDISIHLPVLIRQMDKLEKVKQKIKNSKGNITYFVCCFPDNPNNFISSPLIETRLMGWITKYFKLDGFLRWDYAIWPSDPFNEPSYKFPRWRAGDMFFVYPGKNMNPISSLRWENLKFTIQDYEILNMIDDKKINNILQQVLGKKENMKYVDKYYMHIDCSLEYDDYIDIRNKIIYMVK